MKTVSPLESHQALLAEGLRKVPESVYSHHAEFIQSMITREGGFPGRDSGPNLRSTWYAVRALAMLDALPVDQARLIAAFVRGRAQSIETVEDCCALADLARILGSVLQGDQAVPDFAEATIVLLESQRAGDGGYRKATGLIGGSTTHSLFALLCYRILDIPVPRAEDLSKFILGRRRPDGGFIETAALTKSGAVSTSSGVSLLRILEGPNFRDSEEIAKDAIGFLGSVQSQEGGFLANRQSPLADMVSTYYALWMLHDLGALNRVKLQATRSYVESMAWSTGGFRGGEWDEDTDVEFTFYGLASLALSAHA